MDKLIIKAILDDARFGWRPLPGDVRDLLARNHETQTQAAYRIGVDPRTIRRAASESDRYQLHAHAWALLRLAYLLEEGGASGNEKAQMRAEIDRLRAQLDEYQRDLTDEIGVDRSQDTDWLRAGFLQRGTEIERLEAERDEHERARTALEEAVGQLRTELYEMRDSILMEEDHDD